MWTGNFHSILVSHKVNLGVRGNINRRHTSELTCRDFLCPHDLQFLQGATSHVWQAKVCPNKAEKSETPVDESNFGLEIRIAGLEEIREGK
jgi:hypothetical protein